MAKSGGPDGRAGEGASKSVQCYSAFGTSFAVESPIQLDLEEIARLCRQHRVCRLAIFGSASRPDFDPSRSDADFLVEFEPISTTERMKNYLALREALGALLHRPVDLVEFGAIRNPYILRTVNEQQRTLYAA